MAFLWRKKIERTDIDGKTQLVEVGKYQIGYRIKVNGQWQAKMQTTGTDNLKAALKALGKFEANHVKGVNDILFGDFINHMSRIQSKTTKNFQRKEKYTFDRFTRAFGDLHMSAMTAAKILDWQEGLLDGSGNGKLALAHGTVNKYMRSLRHVFNVAIDREAFSGPSPFSKIEICEAGKPRDLILDPDEQGRLLQACLIPVPHRPTALEPEVLHDIVLFALRLGLRKGEIIGVNRKKDGKDFKVGGLHVRDWDRRSKVLSFYRPKTDSNTSIDLSGFPQMVEILERTVTNKRDPDEFIFKSHGHQIFDIGDAYRRALTFAKIQKLSKITGQPLNFTFHDLRHTACVDMLRVGIHLEVVAHILGDNINTVYKVYANELQEGHVKDAMAQLSKHHDRADKDSIGTLRVVGGRG
jgi:integrase